MNKCCKLNKLGNMWAKKLYDNSLKNVTFEKNIIYNLNSKIKTLCEIRKKHNMILDISYQVYDSGFILIHFHEINGIL